MEESKFKAEVDMMGIEASGFGQYRPASYSDLNNSKNNNPDAGPLELK